MNDELNSGAYQLHIYLSRNVFIEIGKLGKFKFEKGNYVYTGSAMKNLLQRVARHERLANTKDKSILKWHLDYFLTNKFTHLTKIDLFPSGERQECILNQKLLNKKNVNAPVKGFGSSDCRECEAHLVYINKK